MFTNVSLRNTLSFSIVTLIKFPFVFSNWRVGKRYEWPKAPRECFVFWIRREINFHIVNFFYVIFLQVGSSLSKIFVFPVLFCFLLIALLLLLFLLIFYRRIGKFLSVHKSTKIWCQLHCPFGWSIVVPLFIILVYCFYHLSI